MEYFHEQWADSLNDWLVWKTQYVANRKKNQTEKGDDSRLNEYDLTGEYLLEIFPKDHKCPITKRPFTWIGHSKDSPELDRIDSSKGYVKGNVCWISSRMNILKRDSSIEQLESILEYMKKGTPA